MHQSLCTKRPEPCLCSAVRKLLKRACHKNQKAAITNTCCTAPAASEVRAILEDPKADNLESSTPDFWVMVAALRRFVVSWMHAQQYSAMVHNQNEIYQCFRTFMVAIVMYMQ
eukprot:GHUV01031460.1.p3 GENE.GHUV01031460.1~~GHUV01031460.1.p3  ORF type:complete len:113 (+),score=24.84 GHUV01031460.1:420-758(+)